MNKQGKRAIEARRAYSRKWYSKNREARRSYMKVWRKNNPEKVREYTLRHWEKVADEMEAAGKTTEGQARA